MVGEPSNSCELKLYMYTEAKELAKDSLGISAYKWVYNPEYDDNFTDKPTDFRLVTAYHYLASELLMPAMTRLERERQQIKNPLPAAEIGGALIRDLSTIGMSLLLAVCAELSTQNVLMGIAALGISKIVLNGITHFEMKHTDFNS
mgnify:CR=1 FL=1